MNENCLLQNYDYNLPQELIAQMPLEERDNSRLLVYDNNMNSIKHLHFYDLPQLLFPGDMLVLNKTKVIKAKIFGKKFSTGAIVDFLLLEKLDKNKWLVLAKRSKRVKKGDLFIFGNGQLTGMVEKKEKEGSSVLHFNIPDSPETDCENLLEELGDTPLPPYIKQTCQHERYQTIYAEERGSVAAPTAGLHFTEKLLEILKNQGVQIVFITLHINNATFRPVKTEDITQHQMHQEYYFLSNETALKLEKQRLENKRIICVGTTVLRTLESVLRKFGEFKSDEGKTDLFIYPGQKILLNCDMITNFHLPKSTLLMLISALIGRENVFKIYNEAINHKYRFYSFGDAMLIQERA